MSPLPAPPLQADKPPAPSAFKDEDSEEDPLALFSGPKTRRPRKDAPARDSRHLSDAEIRYSLFGSLGDADVAGFGGPSEADDTQAEQAKVNARGLQVMWDGTDYGLIKMGVTTAVAPPKQAGEYMLRHQVDSQG